MFDVVFYLPRIGPLLLADSRSPTGGAETQIFLLSRELARRGYRVALVCFPTPEPLPTSVGGVSVVTRPPPDVGLTRGIGKLLDVVAIWRTLWRLKTPVVVQRSAGFSTGAVAVAARLRGIRFVYSSANVVDFAYERLDPRERNRAVFHLGVRLSEKIIVQTTEQVDLCRRRFGREPELIKSIAEPAPPRRRRPQTFLWIGRLAEYKRPFDYVELARAVPEARFRMVAPSGDQYAGVDPAQLERAVQAVPNLELLPARPRRELMALIEEAVAIVNTAEYEGMPNVFLEGWARAVPALALWHDPDGVIGRADLGYFAGGSMDVLVRRARCLWSQRADQGALGARCRAYVEREHGLQMVADRWTEALELASAQGHR